MDIQRKPKFLTVKINPAADLPYTLVGHHTVVYGDLVFSIPDGFQTDLASIPRWLLLLFSPTGRHQSAALVHDRLYRTQILPRVVADAIFLSLLKYDGVPAWKAYAMYLAVRLFGWTAWRKK
jgi:hypothetical protein